MDFDTVIRNYLLSKNKRYIDKQQIIKLLKPNIDNDIIEIIVQKYIRRLLRDGFAKQDKIKGKDVY